MIGGRARRLLAGSSPRAAGPLVLVAGVLASAPALARESPIQDDETVVFFPAAGRLSDDGSAWTIAIHGWIYEREEGSWLRGEIRDLFAELAGLDPDVAEEPIFRRRATLFLADNERGKKIAIQVGDQVHDLEESGANGHFHGTVSLSREEAARLAAAGAGGANTLAFQAVTRKGDERRFMGRIHLLEPEGLTVISDIDDTIKVSEVADRKALLRNTFCREFRAVPGMADLYREWGRKGASFHYLTASPWQLYEPLAEFIAAAGFPAGTFDMKLFRFKDRTVANLFASPRDHKMAAIASLIAAFPKRKFVLVGDSGELDPEIFGDVFRAYPGRIERLFIRDPAAEAAAAGRYREAFRDVPAERRRLFSDPAEAGPLR